MSIGSGAVRITPVATPRKSAASQSKVGGKELVVEVFDLSDPLERKVDIAQGHGDSGHVVTERLSADEFHRRR